MLYDDFKFASGDEASPPLKPCIGIVGGLAVTSSCIYYQRLYEMFASRDERLELTLIHADLKSVFEYFRRGDAGGLAQYLRPLLSRLRRGGANVAVIPAVAAHLAIEDLQASSEIPIISLLDALRESVKMMGPRRIVVFGTKFVMERHVFGSLDGVAEMATLTTSEIDKVDALYRRFVQRGVAANSDVHALNQIAVRSLKREQADLVILAGTDFAVIPEAKIAFPHISAAEAHLSAVRACILPTAGQESSLATNTSSMRTGRQSH